MVEGKKSDSIWVKMQSIPLIPIQLIFVLLIILPLLLGITIPSTPSTPVREYYNFLNNLPEGSVVVFNSQMYGWNYGDCAPGCAATMNMILRAPNKLKLIVMFVSSDGPMFWDTMKADFGVELPSHTVYGEDYVELGWYVGGETGFSTLLDDFQTIFPEDRYGTPASELPILENVHSGDDIATIIASTSLSALVDYEVRQAYSRYDIPLLFAPAGMTVMSVIPYHPYAVKGYITGLSGAAQLESLINMPTLTSKMGTSFSFMTLEAFVLAILGIVGGYMQSKESE
jgi:hypothetical protein